MNIVLDAPLPAFVAKQEYDNKILFAFLGMMAILVMLGLMFIGLTKELTNSSTVDQPDEQIQLGEYV